MASNLLFLKRKVEKAWTDFQPKLKMMGQSCAVRPTAAAEVFRYEDGDPIKVVVKPLTFLLKERPEHPTADMFVVVEGLIDFRVAGDQSIRAIKSQTRVGYFVARNDKLTHVFGVHHDFDNEHVAHPVFHSQIAPMKDLLPSAIKAWDLKHQDFENHVGRILNNVRIPSAQMDAFSVFLQLCSDHLVNPKSQRTQLSAYKAAIDVCGFFQGAYPEIPRLQAAIEQKCLRPNHWYDGSIQPAKAVSA